MRKCTVQVGVVGTSPHGRSISKEVWAEAIDRAQQQMSARMLFAVFADDTSPNVTIGNQSYVSTQLGTVAGLVTDMYIDGDDVMAEIEIVDTPKGSILEQLTLSGVSLNVSVVASGTVREAPKTLDCELYIGDKEVRQISKGETEIRVSNYEIHKIVVSLPSP